MYVGQFPRHLYFLSLLFYYFFSYLFCYVWSVWGMDRSVFTLSILPKASFIGVDMVTVTFCATSPLPLALWCVPARGLSASGDSERFAFG